MTATTEDPVAEGDPAPVTEGPPRASFLSRVPLWVGPLLIMLVAVGAFMPRSLAGQATSVGVDMMEPLSPLRDTIRRTPDVVSPVQTDQVEVVPNHVSFYDHLRNGEFQLWDPQHGLGTPLGTNPNMFVLSPLSLALVALPSWYALSLRVAILLMVAQGATYGLARRFGVGRGIATVAAVAYAFNGANIVFVHRVNAAFLYPLFLLVLDRAVERPSLRRALAVGGVTAWIWLEGFPASTVHSIYLGALWVLWLLYRYIVRARAEGRLDWKQVGGRVLATGGGVAWGMALAAVNFVYFIQFISSIGLLDQRHQSSAGHLPAVFLFGTFSSGVYGNALDPNDWWLGSNPVEAITTIGGVAMVLCAVAVGLALAGKVRLSRRGRDIWPFLMASTLGLIVVTFIGTGFLGAAYALPGMGDNPLTRIRFALALPVVLLGALGADAFVRRRADGERPPLRSTMLWAGLVLACFVLPSDQFADLAFSKDRLTDLARPILLTLVLAGSVVGLLVVAVRRPAWRPVLAVLAAALVWVDVALPLREFTPEAPVGDFYPETDGHRALQRLAGDEYRFAASGVDYYPNDATLHGLFDLRGATLRPERVKDFIRLANPKAFDRDYMKLLLARDEWNLASPVYDELSLKYFVVGTAMSPLGTPVRVTGEPGTETVAATEASPVVTSLELPAGTAGVGFVARARGAGCPKAELTVEARQGAETRRTQRPAMDAVGDWVDLGLVAQDLDPSVPTELTIGPDRAACRIELATAGDGPAVRAIVEDPSGPVRLVDVADGWIYERPGAKPMVRASADWDIAPSATAAREAFQSDPSRAVVIGTDKLPTDPSSTPVLTGTQFGDNEVTTTVESEGRSLVTVAQSATTGWKVSIDGEPAPLVQLFGGLTAVVVPPGRHEVQFAFRPRAFYLGAGISGLALVSGLGALAVDEFLRRRRRRAAVVLSDGSAVAQPPEPPAAEDRTASSNS